jgi:hypothetical protein
LLPGSAGWRIVADLGGIRPRAAAPVGAALLFWIPSRCVGARSNIAERHARRTAHRQLRADAVVGDKRAGVAVGGGDAGGGDGFAAVEPARDVEVEVEELGEQVGAGVEAVGVECGGVERALGVLERILAGQLQRAVEGAEAAGDLGQRFRADAADFAAGGGDGSGKSRIGMRCLTLPRRQTAATLSSSCIPMPTTWTSLPSTVVVNGIVRWSSITVRKAVLTSESLQQSTVACSISSARRRLAIGRPASFFGRLSMASAVRSKRMGAWAQAL